MKSEERDLYHASKAYQQMLICYRLGKKPSEQLIKRVEKAEKVLKAIDEVLIERNNPEVEDEE